MTNDDKSKRARTQSIFTLIKEEEDRLMKEGLAARAKENAAWQSTKALMQRLGAPKAK